MAFADLLPFELAFYPSVAVAALVSLVGTFVAMPKIIRKLVGAGIKGRDINKPGRPEVAEMGGIGVFLGFNGGVFAFLVLHPLAEAQQILVLVALITAAGAAMTGVMDDLVSLRQRFKAFIPVVFAAPLAIFVSDYSIQFPFVGAVDFGLLYPLLLVPLGIACAANGFNMLEGFNGLGAGLGIVMAAGMSALVVMNGHPEALVLTLPLAGGLLAFVWFNKYPAKVFPGDTMTLFAGAVLAIAGMIGKVEFWGALLFLPHIAEFILKLNGSFKAENFAARVVSNPPDPPVLEYDGRLESLTHIILRRPAMTEPRVTIMLVTAMIALTGLVIVAYASTF